MAISAAEQYMLELINRARLDPLGEAARQGIGLNDNLTPDRLHSGVRGVLAHDEALERAAITCNKNGIPFDPLPPVKTSGIRVGSPAGTTRGFGPAEFREIGDMIADVLDALAAKGEHGDPAVEKAVNDRRRALCARFPIYPEA